MASMAGMETGPEGQPIDVMQAQGKFKVRLLLTNTCFSNWKLQIDLDMKKINFRDSHPNSQYWKYSKIFLVWNWRGGCEQEIQNKREETLKARLLEHIEPYVQGNKDQFVNWAKEERNRLKEAGTSSLPLCLF